MGVNRIFEEVLTKILKNEKTVFFICFTFFMFIACGSDNNEINHEEEAKQNQTEIYNKVMSKIVGHWKGYQYYNKIEWTDISKIKWSQEYIFNSDGTCLDISSPNLIYEGKYSIVKNERYIKYPTTLCELFIIITYNNGLEFEKGIWIDDFEEEYLHISLTVDGIRPNKLGGGEAAIRYRKE